MELEKVIYNFSLDKYFSVTSNVLPEDPELTWDAKGILWYLISRPRNQEVFVDQIYKLYQGDKKGSGRDAVYVFIRELEQHGYITCHKEKDKQGRTRCKVVVNREKSCM